MKQSSLQEPFKSQHREYVAARWRQLSDLSNDSANQAIRYLYISNSGAAAGVITFLGVFEELRDQLWPRWMLILFFVGVLLVGIFWASRYHRTEYLFKRFRDDVHLCAAEKIEVEDLEMRDWQRVNKTAWLPLICAYSSFICFIGGAIIGLTNLIK